MVSIQMEYQGDLHCKAVHGPSSTELFTDAPKDNQGRGESFSPTDLVATALGTCILTTMGIMARTLNVDITGATATVEKDMTTSPRAGLPASPPPSTSPTPSRPKPNSSLSAPPTPAPSTDPSTPTSRCPSTSPGHNVHSAPRSQHIGVSPA